MPKVFKPGWDYMYSNELKQEVAINFKTGLAYCEDKTIYKLEEIKIMDTAKQKITSGIHLVKKVFGGEIVDFIHRENRNDRN
jgi:phage gp36-like protein